jgi:integrase
VATSGSWGESCRARRNHVAGDRRFVHLAGTKTDYRERDVPIVTSDQRGLLDYALEHADRPGDLLFYPWANVRRDLLEACKRAGIERCSPNDLRRTCATWLRAGGASIDALAPLMGHADGRMVERVYGRLQPEQLRARLEKEVLGHVTVPDCITAASDSVDSHGFAGPNGRGGDGDPEEVSGITVPRGGIEPPTRGFSVPCSTD